MQPPRPTRVGEIRTSLLAHYDRTRRALPWRADPDPYRVWVSEVMLQQTRVDTAIPYYLRWMERFPDVDALAGATEDEVLEAWAGLGYYSRARNLHRAAQIVREKHGGNVPGSPTELRALPGVGEYTAGAVASIAFGLPAAAVDGNVRRVLARLLDDPEPHPSDLREAARALVDPERPGDFNQALMELGATVCTPQRPRCEVCPIRSGCLAVERGTVDSRPAPGKARPVPSVIIATAALVRRGRAGFELLLRRRPPEGLLARMWELPGTEVDHEGDALGALRAWLADLGIRAEDSKALHSAALRSTALHFAALRSPTPLSPVRHRFSHLEATYVPVMFPVLVATADGRFGPDVLPDPEQWRWAPLSGIEDLALPAAQLKMGRAVDDYLHGIYSSEG